MKDFRGGVSYYTMATVDVGFPEDKVCCAFCPMLETYARKQCRRTGEYIADDRYIGYYCPLKFDIEENKK
jgi:hypothetical protein